MKETLEEAIRLAGSILLEKFGRLVSIERKESHNSIVTDADLAAEDAMVRLIEERYPAHNIVAEESGFRNRGSDFTWVIDPLDGTSNYAVGLPWFGVMGAVLQERTPVIGMMYLPLEDRLYLGEKGKGATCNGDPLAVTREAQLENVLCAYAQDSCADPGQRARQLNLYDRLAQRTRNLRATNSLFDFIAVIDGRLGAAVNHCTMIWDIAAIRLILQEAGGRLSTLDGEPVILQPDETACSRDYAVIGANAALTAEISRLWKAT